MRLSRTLPLFILLAMILIASGLWNNTVPTIAQDQDAGTPPRAITPGEPLFPERIVPTLDPDVCLDPLPINIGDTIYIKDNVNIRAEPDGSTGIVWNTSYNNVDEEGTPISPPNNIGAVVLEGPVCNDGYNWYRVSLYGNDGWVADGRPDRAEGGYLLIVPGFTFDIDCSPAFELLVGDDARLLRNVRVRYAPTTDAGTLTVAQAGSLVQIIAGPECVGGYLWWLVRVEVLGSEYVGWMAEGADERFWLVPDPLPSYEDGTLCGNPLPFDVGQQGFVYSVHNDTPKYLRAAPGVASPALYQLVENTPFVFIGAPVCRDNLNWWQVEILASTPVYGWIAEGSSGVGYWLTIIDPDEYR